jgi:4a-hydroxytetrahydrobiopterin dehydratase
MNTLLNQKCRPLEGGSPMSADEIDTRLRQLGGWTLKNGAIEKTYTFDNYHRTMAFVNALAWIAHAEDHHPDLLVKYGSCQVRFNTHSVGGISINDFICAAKADALLG